MIEGRGVRGEGVTKITGRGERGVVTADRGDRGEW